MHLDREFSGYGVAAATDEAWKLSGGKPGAKVAIKGLAQLAEVPFMVEKQGYKVVAIADINATYK